MQLAIRRYDDPALVMRASKGGRDLPRVVLRARSDSAGRVRPRQLDRRCRMLSDGDRFEHARRQEQPRRGVSL